MGRIRFLDQNLSLLRITQRSTVNLVQTLTISMAIKDNVVVLIRHRQHNLYFVVILLRYSILLYTVYNVFLGLHPSTSNKKTQLLPTIGVIHWTRRSFRRVVILLRYIIMLYHCTWRGRRYKRGKRRETTSR